MPHPFAAPNCPGCVPGSQSLYERRGSTLNRDPAAYLPPFFLPPQNPAKVSKLDRCSFSGEGYVDVGFYREKKNLRRISLSLSLFFVRVEAERGGSFHRIAWEV